MTRESNLNGGALPDRLYMEAPGVARADCLRMAYLAVDHARARMPKMTGAGARSIKPLWGEGFFGLRWEDPYVWYQEVGIHPFTMRKLAGKLIPMWIPDPTGKEQRNNPKAKTKKSEDGRTFVLIFRRAAKIGQRKTVSKAGIQTTVAASYPGAPGRISRRQVGRPHTTVGKLGGAIGRPNGGVRWRHPGLTPRSFLHQGLVQAANESGVAPTQVYATTQRWD